MKVARVRDEYATKSRTAESMPNNDPHDTHSTANWKRAYPLSRDPWDSETESHRKPVTPLHLSGRGFLEWTLAKKFKRAYPLSRDPWDSETESHRKPVTPLHLSGRGFLEWTLAKKFSNAWRRRTRPRS
jgi:hypothetical protein